MNKIIRLSLLAVSILCVSCGSSNPDKKEIKTIYFNVEAGRDDTPYVCNEMVQDYYENYERGYSLKYQGSGDIFASDGLTLKWSGYSKASSYKIKISINEDMSNFNEYVTSQNELVVPDLFINYTYYWQIIPLGQNDAELGISPVYSFQTVGTPRTISIDGVSNSRDIGGYITVEGKRVKQNTVFRSANLDGVTDDGIEKATNYYGIKFDLDLRKSGEGTCGLGSPLGNDIGYKNIQGPYWVTGTTGFDYQGNFASIKQEMLTFTKKENFPLIIHCSIGQDRTGSLCFLLGALLGINGRDLAMDYEMSSFSASAGGADIRIVDKFKYQYNPLETYIASFGPKESLMIAAENYCKNKLGLTDSNIQSIRDNLLEEK